MTHHVEEHGIEAPRAPLHRPSRRSHRGWIAALAVSVVAAMVAGVLVWREVRAEVVFDESADGPSLRPYASASLNGEHPLWHVEPGSTPVDRFDGKISKVGEEQFHRMFSTVRLGGPGTTLTIRFRGRATAIRERDGSSIVEGAKIGLRFPNPSSRYAQDDPRSAHGTGEEPSSPGSYQFLTGLTSGGYLELARNGYGPDGYTLFANRSVGYTPGTWMDVVTTVEWLPQSTVRVRYWHNADGDGEPVYEAVDVGSPFAAQSGFLWLRSDDTDWEYGFIRVEQD